MMTTTLPIVGDTPYPSVCLESRLSPDANRVKRETIVASSTAINRDKRHCACVLTIFSFLQMLGHLSPTTRVYYASSTTKTRTKRHCACVWMCLQMVGTHILPRACQASPHVYYETSTAKTRTNAIAHAYGCVCRWWGHLYRTTSLPR